MTFLPLRLAAALSAVLAATTGCAGRPAAPHAAPVAHGSTAPTPSQPDQKICRTTAGYYLLITSATMHQFDACQHQVLYRGTIDTLLNQPRMERRCVLGDAYTAAHNATVGVYSDAKPGDMAAAHAFCQANGGAR